MEIVNKKAKYEYNFLEQYEAGIVLSGTEIKSIRAGQVNMKEAYCSFDKAGELFVYALHISEYTFGNRENHEPKRKRKLLLKRQELKKLRRKVSEKGFTIIPYKMYLNERGIAKLEVAIASGKKSYDKRQSIKDKDMKREYDRSKKYDM